MACAHCISSQRPSCRLLVRLARCNRHLEAADVRAQAATDNENLTQGTLMQSCDPVGRLLFARRFRAAVPRLVMCVK